MRRPEDISCIFCGASNLVTRSHCSGCREPLHVAEEFEGQIVGNYKLVRYHARGFYGLTFEAKDELGGKPFAIKLLSKAAYTKHNKDFTDEVRVHGQLPNTPSIVGYVGAGSQELTAIGKTVDFHYIVSGWISGPTLADFLTSSNVHAEDLIVAARDLLSAANVMNERQVWHNDLHDENVIVHELSETEMRVYRRTVAHMFVIVDIGSMVFKNPGDVKAFGDIANIGAHLSRLCSALQKKILNLTKEDQFFVTATEAFCAHLIDESPSRTFATPMEALDMLERHYSLSRRGQVPEQKELEDPYGYINANDIPSHWLLRNMFSDRFVYFRQVSSASEQCLLITGPRGCGKTMLLKNMRFLTLCDSKTGSAEAFIGSLSQIGLFFSARSNFGNYLVSYRQQQWVRDEAKVMLYFNILITVEVIDVLYRLRLDGLADDQELSVVLQLIAKNLKLKYITLLTAKDALVQLSRRIIDEENVPVGPSNSTPAYLNELFSALSSALRAIRGKPIVLLIDDLSMPRIPEPIQQALLPALFNTGATYKTRISAHSEGLKLQDKSGEDYKENRDFRQINLGYEYWILSEDYGACRDGFDDILRKRFELASRSDYTGLEGMLGLGDELQDIGKEIHRLAQSKRLRSLKYHGSKVIIKLCSGDLSYLLDMLGKMERLATKRRPVGIKVQNTVIRNYARNELLRLQDIRAECVPSIYDIAFYFGVWSRSKLEKGGGDYIRLELSVRNLSSDSLTTSKELLWHGVFIDGGFSNMSDGELARRLLFRRIYTPAFPTTFNNRETFAMRDHHFAEFIRRPRDFIKKRMSEDQIPPIEQQRLEQLELPE
jgi:hypothetical protein